MTKECKICQQRKIINTSSNKDKIFYNHCCANKREDSLLKEDDFSNFSCELFSAIDCEVVPYKRQELFRSFKEDTEPKEKEKKKRGRKPKSEQNKN